jgi:hypothetical protein
VIFDDHGRRIGGARLLAVVTLAHAPLTHARGSDVGEEVVAERDDRRADGAASVSERGVSERGRQFRLPTERDYEAVWKAEKQLKKLLQEWERGGREGLCPVPDEPLPPQGTLGFRVQLYGMLNGVTSSPPARRWRSHCFVRSMTGCHGVKALELETSQQWRLVEAGFRFG